MKDWCLQHPYLTFFIVITAISTFGNVVMKLLDVFIKPAPTTVNMSIDPSKIPGYVATSPVDDEGTVH